MPSSAAHEDVLERYLRPFHGRWTKRFPDEYYQELYRLKGWTWPGPGAIHPPIVGDITNDLVYARMADDLLDQLRLKNPKNPDGERKCKHHQWLTDDFGVQELREHMVGVTAIMRTIQDPDPVRAWKKFLTRLDHACPRKRNRYRFER
ncbi:MAG: hypothetical protein F4Y04_04645 [Chloroflexi bacterium]|nr:hypothetical protein [Chloroflexota bacterium]